VSACVDVDPDCAEDVYERLSLVTAVVDVELEDEAEDEVDAVVEAVPEDVAAVADAEDAAWVAAAMPPVSASIPATVALPAMRRARRAGCGRRRRGGAGTDGGVEAMFTRSLGLGVFGRA
jgi:anti-sigma factor RsiW